MIYRNYKLGDKILPENKESCILFILAHDFMIKNSKDNINYVGLKLVTKTLKHQRQEIYIFSTLM